MAERHVTIKAKLLLAVLPAVTVLAIITVVLLTSYFRQSTKQTAYSAASRPPIPIKVGH